MIDLVKADPGEQGTSGITTENPTGVEYSGSNGDISDHA